MAEGLTLAFSSKVINELGDKKSERILTVREFWLDFLGTTLKLDSHMDKKLHLCWLPSNSFYFLGAVLTTSEMTWMWLLPRNLGISLGVQKSQKPLILWSANLKGPWDTIRVLTHQPLSCETSRASASCFASEQQNQCWSWDIKQVHTYKWIPGS